MRKIIGYTCTLISLLVPLGLSAEKWSVTATVESIDSDNTQFVLKDVSSTDAANAFSEESLKAKVTYGDALIDYVGKPIRGMLTQEEAGYRLDTIWPNVEKEVKLETAINKLLKEGSVAEGTKEFLGEGATLPDFAFYDQEGRLTRKKDLMGKVTVMNFIFTRCGLPEMCPASTQRMVDVQERVKKVGMQDVKLVSLTFDPEFDTPGILKAYGKGYGMDFDMFSLLTGEYDSILSLTTQFGLWVIPDDKTINHTMTTIIIDRKGKIVHRVNGSEWNARDFVSVLIKL